MTAPAASRGLIRGHRLAAFESKHRCDHNQTPTRIGRIITACGPVVAVSSPTFFITSSQKACAVCTAPGPGLTLSQIRRASPTPEVAALQSGQDNADHDPGQDGDRQRKPRRPANPESSVGQQIGGANQAGDVAGRPEQRRCHHRQQAQDQRPKSAVRRQS